ncbi:hypothetical protein COOONC_22561 [Cooperia oncophora]
MVERVTEHESTSESLCICPRGYTGPNCQFEECTRRSPVTFSANAKTFVLVAEVTKQSLDAVNGLIAQLSSIVKGAIADHPSWFVNYVLVTFDCEYCNLLVVRMFS